MQKALTMEKGTKNSINVPKAKKIYQTLKNRLKSKKQQKSKKAPKLKKKILKILKKAQFRNAFQSNYHTC